MAPFTFPGVREPAHPVFRTAARAFNMNRYQLLGMAVGAPELVMNTLLVIIVLLLVHILQQTVYFINPGAQRTDGFRR